MLQKDNTGQNLFKVTIRKKLGKILKQLLTASDGTSALEMNLSGALYTSSFPRHSASINILKKLLFPLHHS